VTTRTRERTRNRAAERWGARCGPTRYPLSALRMRGAPPISARRGDALEPKPPFSERRCARLAVLAAIVAAVSLFSAAPASATLTELETQHMSQLTEWVYRNGAAKNPLGCALTCKEMWAREHSSQFDEPPQEALDAFGTLETEATGLLGSLHELSKEIAFHDNSITKAQYLAGWKTTNGTSEANKWMKLSGPTRPSLVTGECTQEWSTGLLLRGEEVGTTFFEHATAPGNEWYLLDCSQSDLITEYVKQRINPEGSGCNELTPPPEFEAPWTRQEWWWNACYEGFPENSKVYAEAYYQPFHFGLPQDFVGQHLEGEGAHNLELNDASDPGVSAVEKATERALGESAKFSEWVQQLLELSLGGSEEQFGALHGQAPNRPTCFKGKPVNCATGDQVETQTDLAVAGRGPGLTLTRTYNSQLAAGQTAPGSFGYGWTGPYTAHLEVNNELGLATVHQDDGSAVRFLSSEAHWYPLGALVQATLSQEGTAWVYTLPDQSTLHFNAAGQLTTESDRNANTLTMNRNGEGRLESVSDPAGRRLTFAYNAQGQVESATDPMGHIAKYAYEGGNLASVTLPGEATPRWSFKYDGSHQLTTETDGRSHSVTTEYDSSHRVISQTDPLERKRTWKYTTSGEQTETTITEPNGAVTVEKFNVADLPVNVTRAYRTSLEATTTYEYDGSGNLIALTDPNKHTTKYTYNAAGDRTSETNADGNETKWEYNATHDVISTTTPKGETTTIKRDSHGNPEVIERPAPGAKTQITKYKYDSLGDLESVTDPLERKWSYEYDSKGDRGAEIDPEGDKRTWAYSEDSQETSTVSPRGNVKGAEASKYTTKIERDLQGRVLSVTDPLGHVTKYEYDKNGNLEAQTDPNAHKTKYTYDADNEQTKVEEPNKTITETGYDAAGQVTSQLDGNKHTTKYVRNGLEQVTEVIDPRERKTVKEYDADGNLHGVKDPAQRTTTYTYDPANRLTEGVYSDGKTPAVKYEYDADGNRSKMTDGTGTSSYTYDQLDRLTEAKDGHGDATGYEYDLANEQTKITYPNGKAVTRAYDNTGRLKSATDWLEHTTKFAYDADSNQTATTFPTGTSDEDKFVYNAADQMGEVKMLKGTETLASLVYTRDSDGQLKAVTGKGLPGEESQSYEYDANNRLKKGGNTAYEYDAADNVTKIGSGTYKYDAASQLETGPSVTYSFDALGERTKATPTKGPATTYGYDQAGNLISVTRPKEGTTTAIEDSYAYDGNGLRASQKIGTATTYLVWNASERLPLILNDGQNSYIYGPGGLPVEQINGEGKVFYLHHDQQGSTRMLTGSTGKSEGTKTFNAYGSQIGTSGSATTPLGYDGQYTSTDTGLIYLRARVYDPATAQFVSVDPIFAVTRAPYVYVHDNPLTFRDWQGLAPAFLGAGAADAACGVTFEIPGVDALTCGAAAGTTAAGVLGATVGILTSVAGEEEGNDEGEAILKQRQAEEAAKEHEQACRNTPPGYEPKTWTKGPASRPSNPGESFYDPEGGEWNWHPSDKYHPEGHWNYKGPGSHARWENIYP
jgi:RHS repeat-associated protein